MKTIVRYKDEYGTLLTDIPEELENIREKDFITILGLKDDCVFLITTYNKYVRRNNVCMNGGEVLA